MTLVAKINRRQKLVLSKASLGPGGHAIGCVVDERRGVEEIRRVRNIITSNKCHDVVVMIRTIVKLEWADRGGRCCRIVLSTDNGHLHDPGLQLTHGGPATTTIAAASLIAGPLVSAAKGFGPEMCAAKMSSGIVVGAVRLATCACLALGQWPNEGNRGAESDGSWVAAHVLPDNMAVPGVDVTAQFMFTSEALWLVVAMRAKDFGTTRPPVWRPWDPEPPLRPMREIGLAGRWKR